MLIYNTAQHQNSKISKKSRKIAIHEIDYRIYSKERPGRSFNFKFSEGGAYSREALIEYIKKTSKYLQLVS